jgi:hypothetical protein
MRDFTAGHWFWWLLVAACIVWYSTVTIVVTVKGWTEIRAMLRRLGRGVPPDDE